MKKYILSFFLIFSFLGYSLYERKNVSKQYITRPKRTQQTSARSVMPTATAGSGKTPLQNTDNNQLTITQTSPMYKDGSYTGDVADAFYGNIQVQAMFQNGKIIDIQFLQYPNDSQTSTEINTRAIPSLKQEAIQAQSAQVDIVSGATQSSQAFIQSLQSALKKAKNS